MAWFIEDNWPATKEQLEIANSAYHAAWLALKPQLIDMLDDEEAAWRKNLGDAINNAFTDDTSAETIAQRALTRLGYAA